MLGENPAQHPGATGDQHRVLRIEHHRRQQHNFPAVSGLAHVAEGLTGRYQPVAGARQRLQRTSGEPFDQHRPQPSDPIR